MSNLLMKTRIKLEYNSVTQKHNIRLMTGAADVFSKPVSQVNIKVWAD
jgi:hypothetical protein